MARHRASKAETSEREAAEGGLDHGRREAGPRVEEAEETDERLALPEVRHRLGLEDVVHESGENGGEAHHQGEVHEQGLPPDLAPARGLVRLLGARRPWGGALPHRQGPGDAGRAQQAQEEEQAPPGKERSHPFGGDAADQASKRGRSGHPGHEGLGRVGVVALVEERPERRDPDGSEHARVEVEKDRREARLPGEEPIFGQEEERTRREEGHDDPGGPEARHGPARDLRRGERQEGGPRHEVGQVLYREGRQEQAVADRVRPHLLRDEDRSREGCHERRLRLAQCVPPAIWSRRLFTRAPASSYSYPST